MKIEKAIEILPRLIKELPATLDEEEKNAIGLGIEALQRLKEHREEHTDICAFRSLPSETILT